MQRNGYDCGVFALQFLEHESRAAPLHFAQNDMPYYRMRIALDLLQGTVPDNPP
jgi:sentrin-specific protease 1